MKIAVHLARNRRLLGWCVLSVTAHLLTLHWLDRAVAPRAPTRPDAALAVRLARAQPAAPLPRSAAPATQPGAAARPEAAATAPSAPLPPGTVTLVPSGAQILSPTHVDATAPAAAPDRALLSAAPGRYRVSPPPSAQLTYEVTRASADGSAVAAAPGYLVWQRQGNSYRLEVDGVLGRIDSEGGEDDAGMSPASSREHGAAGSTLVTRFNRGEERIEYPTGSTDLPVGSQDMASLLIQLAGMGLADPDQMRDVIAIVVGGAAGTRILRFQAIGEEALDTGAGTLATVHLAQLTGTGERRIELWLAPAHHWMPAQIRVVEQDGSFANQLMTRIETAPRAPGS